MNHIQRIAHSVKPIKPRTTVIDGIVFLFIFMFGYVIIRNLWDFRVFQSQMGLQVFSAPISDILSYVIPLLLFVAIGLLFDKRTREIGLLYVVILMFFLTSCTILILLKVFDSIPYSCISVFEGMGWEHQLVFNLAFSLIALFAILLNRKEVEN